MKKNILLIVCTVFILSCTNKIQLKNAEKSINFWLTKGDQSVLLQKQPALIFGEIPNEFPTIEIDETQRFQTIDGFGYTLTGGSAFLINRMNKSEKSALLNELFGNNPESIAISYLRISIGASDLDETVFSYDDLPEGKTDPNLENFSLKTDPNKVISLLKEILKINPRIKILATSWSPPTWMKTNNSTIGGSLLPQYYETYAKYFVKYLQEMAAEGIRIDALTIQNEPEHGGNNPSMLMTATEQADFIKNHLGKALKMANLTTKIIIYDHNCDKPNYPISILNDADAKQWIDGSAFHLYNGDISALSKVREAHPDKNLYFTEQWTGAKGDFDGDLKWHLKNVIIGSMRNWSKTALEWNLANDPTFKPYSPGGCTECKGALTIDGSTVSRNVSYYIIAHVSKFVPAGSVRIGSNLVGNLQNVAFLTPEGKRILLVENDGNKEAIFNINHNQKWAKISLSAGSVATFVW